MSSIILIAFSAIRAHKLRSFLTLLGVIIGVTAIIGMMAIIQGIQLEMERQISILQAAVFQVQKWPMIEGFGPRQRRGERPNIVVAYADEIRERCPAVSLVGPEVWQFGVTVARGENSSPPSFTLAGGSPEFFPNNGYFVDEGRALTQADVDHNKKVVVVGQNAVEELFPFEDPLGKEVRLIFSMGGFGWDGDEQEAITYTDRFTVVGVLEERGNMMGDNKDDRLVIPISTFEKHFGDFRSINITIQARTPDRFDEAQEQVIGLMRQLRGLRPDEEDNFAIYSSQMGIEQFNQMTKYIKIAAVGICALALLVAGIGIMNIMLVSVSERTREIGVRKALGARPRDILRQFVVEAIVLSEIGGLIGVAFGLGLAYVLATAVPALRASIPLWAVLVGLGFCSLVGLFFGIYPASRAAKLDPIDALRYE